MSSQDRLSELYLGQIGDRQEQQHCKDRLNWLSKQARGPRVLDVGCNQGMTAILIGRLGHQVTGIELESESIKFANQLLQQEETNVQDRVQFETVDPSQMPYLDDSFNSAILSSTFETLEDPNNILQEVKRVVQANGTLATSLDLGFALHHTGLKRNHLLTGFLEQTEKQFTVIDLKFSNETLFAELKNMTPKTSSRLDPDRFWKWTQAFEVECSRYQKAERQRIEVSEIRLSELEEAKASLESDYKTLQQEAQTQGESHAQEIHQITSEAREFQNRANNLELEKNRAESEILALSEQLNKVQPTNEALNQLQTELDNQRHQTDETGALLVKQKESNAKLSETIVRLETELRATNDRALLVEKDLSEQKATSTGMRANTEDLQSRFHETNAKLQITNGDLGRLKEENQRLNQMLTQFETERDQLKLRQIESAESIREERESARLLERNMARVEQEREQLHDDLKDLSAQFKSERTFSREVTEDRQRLQIEAASLQSEVSILREVHTEGQERLRKAEANSEELNKDLLQTQQKLREIEFDFRSTQEANVREKNELERNVEYLTTHLSESNASLSELKKDHQVSLNRSETQLKALTQKVKETDAAWSRQRETLKEAMARSRVLQNDLFLSEETMNKARALAVEAEARREELEIEQARLKDTFKSNRSEQETVRAELAQQISKLETEFNGASHQAAQEKSRADDLESEWLRSTHLLEELNAQLSRAQEDRAEIEAELTERRDYIDRINSLFKNEQEDHRKVFESLKRYTAAFEERGQKLNLITSTAEDRGRRLEALEAQYKSVTEARSYRAISRVNRLLRAVRLRGPAAVATELNPTSLLPASTGQKISKVTPNLPGAPRESNTHMPARSLPRTAAILDEFSMACFAPDCDMITFRTDNWRERLEAQKPKLLLVESAWHGNDDSWQYRVASYEKNMGDELKDLITWCKGESIPTVFWNKEDPVHYDRFIDSAKLFDIILTSDVRCTEQYQSEVGHKRVHALPFAAQPSIHNPVRDEPRSAEVCFAGSYYANRFEQRREDMDNILKPALDYGLEIFDRNHGLVIPGTDHFRFPDIYQNAIQGRLEYDDMIKAYRKYKVFLNVNSVKNSLTMFSRRVFELLACGTPVITTPSVGISQLLGDDLVLRAESEHETREALEALLKNESEWARISALGIRKVLNEHTYKVRFDSVLKFAGLSLDDEVPPNIVCIADPKNRDELDALTATLLEQSHAPDTLILLDTRKIKKKWIRESESRLNSQQIKVRTLIQSDFRVAIQAFDPATVLTFISPHDLYGREYLADHLQSFIYSPTGVLGKASHFEQKEPNTPPRLLRSEEEHCLVTSVPRGSVCARKGALSPAEIEELAYGNTPSFEHASIYGGTRFNFCKLAAHQKPNTLSEEIRQGICI